MQEKKLFWYNVEYKVPVEITNEEGKKVAETKSETFKECFNIDHVLSSKRTNKDTLTIFLNDGHEMAEDVQKPVYKNGKQAGVEVKRERNWYLTQIKLTGDDIERFIAVTEVPDPRGKETSSKRLYGEKEPLVEV